jgi:rare lipoprotein A
LRIHLALLVLLCAAAPAQLKSTLNIPSPKTRGIASWYGKREQGKPMANGQPFDRNKYTAASRTYKLGTYLEVTYPRTGITVLVRVTDRGPWVKGRVIDLSERAATTLGLKQRGLGEVEIQPLHFRPL